MGPTVVRRLAAAGRSSHSPAETQGRSTHSPRKPRWTRTRRPSTSSTPTPRAWADGIADRLGRVDALLHLVGGWRGGKPIEESPREDWDFLSSLLIDTLQNVTQAFVPHLLASGRGRFAIVGAGQAQSPTNTNAAYAAAKAAAEAWTLALADRFRGTGATANIVVVGSIVSPEMRAEAPDKDFSTFTPAESIADALAYLCSDAAAPMNGQRLTLRGAV